MKELVVSCVRVALKDPNKLVDEQTIADGSWYARWRALPDERRRDESRTLRDLMADVTGDIHTDVSTVHIAGHRRGIFVRWRAHGRGRARRR